MQDIANTNVDESHSDDSGDEDSEQGNHISIVILTEFQYCFLMQTNIFKNSMSLWKTQNKLICNI